jgi:internalin A
MTVRIVLASVFVRSACFRGSAMSRLLFAFGVTVLVTGSACRADDAEDKAVKFVTDLRGKVVRDDKLPGKPVVTVRLFVTQVKDAGLKELAALKDLTALDLIDTKATDAGLKELRRALPKCIIVK